MVSTGTANFGLDFGSSLDKENVTCLKDGINMDHIGAHPNLHQPETNTTFFFKHLGPPQTNVLLVITFRMGYLEFSESCRARL